jgi:hypothetical protein
MADIANAAILASLVVGMVSIPAASGSIDSQNSIAEPVENISSTESVPTEESTELDTDSFTRTVSTAFSSFRTSIESGEVQGQLETTQSDLRLEKDAGSVTWTLETPQGRLEVEQTSTGVTEITETPQGTLTEETDNGAYSTRFEGSDREAVEETSEELRDMMEEKRQEYLQKSDRMRTEQYRQGINLDVAPETPEKAIIRNEMDQSLDLEGWEVANNNPDRDELNVTLESGQELHLYSAEEDDEELENVTENDEDIYVYGSGLTWEDGGDTATLFDSQGNEVERYSY